MIKPPSGGFLRSKIVEKIKKVVPKKVLTLAYAV